MSHRWIVPVFLSALLLLQANCSNSESPNANDNANTNTNENTSTDGDQSGRVSGRLTVLARQARTTLLETEPNDTPDEAQSTVSVQPGANVEIFGRLSVAEGDRSDSFVFEVAAPVVVSARLLFDSDPEQPGNVDFAFAVSDFASKSCSLGVDAQMFSECFDSDRNPESATFEVVGNFALIVQAIQGEGNYELGLVFESPTASAAGTNSIKRVGLAQHSPSPKVRGEIVAEFEQQLSTEDCQRIIADGGLEVLARSPAGYYLLRLPDRQVSSAHLQRTLNSLLSHPSVRLAEPNYRYTIAEVPNDEFFELQWHYDLISLPEAWDVTVGSEDVIVAVVDTGILTEHPEFSERLIAGYDLISDSEAARDGDGVDPDPFDEGDLAGGPSQSSFHGSHVAGTIGATSNNESGVSGVTWIGSIMPVRALGVGGGSSFDIAEAIRFAAQIDNVSGALPAKPADVINLSIAGPAGSPPSVLLANAISEAVAKGIAVVAAAGNEASSEPAFPAAFADTISVSACDPQLALAPYSNFGSTIDISAPGGNLALDLTGDGWGDGVLSLTGSEVDGGIEFGLSFQHGTSMASPHVAGVIALMKSVNPELTLDQIRSILSDTATDVGDPGKDDFFGAGVVNAALAVNEAATAGGEAAPTDPQISLSIQSLSFGNTIDRLTVRITNTGGGVLAVTEVTTQEIVASGWLEVTRQTASDRTTVSGLVVDVSREGLAEGTYFATIEVLAEGQDAQEIVVVMTVGEGDAVDDTIFVVAIDAETRVTIVQDETTRARNFEFELVLPPGTYKIYAGTDRDLDDLICDIGELCGALPSAIEANEITIEAKQVREDIDFAVGELIFQSHLGERIMGPSGSGSDRARFRPIQSSGN